MARDNKNKKRLGAVSVILAISASAACASAPVSATATAPRFDVVKLAETAAGYLPGAIAPAFNLTAQTLAAPALKTMLDQVRTAISLAMAKQDASHAASDDMASLTTASLKPATIPAQNPAQNPLVAPKLPDGAVFDTVAIPFKRLAALSKFAPSLAEMNSGKAFACKASGCNAAFQTVHLASVETGSASVRDRLNAVNAAVNGAIRYSSDKDTYGQEDHWATPSETLAMQKGDCEDFAILKMAALRAEGFDPSQMSIVVLFDQKRHFYHAVLSVAVGGNYFILDNMRNQVLLDTQLPDYRPLYSIRDGKGYLHGSRRKDQNLAQNLTGAVALEKIAPGEGVTF